ncbi:hypothetical protein QL285_000731 [Trifolium repens]|nr:hypothetical protein QL285_000731 [Trifolium repens]
MRGAALRTTVCSVHRRWDCGGSHGGFVILVRFVVFLTRFRSSSVQSVSFCLCFDLFGGGFVLILWWSPHHHFSCFCFLICFCLVCFWWCGCFTAVGGGGVGVSTSVVVLVFLIRAWCSAFTRVSVPRVSCFLVFGSRACSVYLTGWSGSGLGFLRRLWFCYWFTHLGGDSDGSEMEVMRSVMVAMDL